MMMEDITQHKIRSIKKTYQKLEPIVAYLYNYND